MGGQQVLIGVGHIHAAAGEGLSEGSQHGEGIGGECHVVEDDGLEGTGAQLLGVEVIADIYGDGLGVLVPVVVLDGTDLLGGDVEAQSLPVLHDDVGNGAVDLVVGGDGQLEGVLGGLDAGLGQQSGGLSGVGAQVLVSSGAGVAEQNLAVAGLKHTGGNQTGSGLSVDDGVHDGVTVNGQRQSLANLGISEELCALLGAVVHDGILVEVDGVGGEGLIGDHGVGGDGAVLAECQRHVSDVHDHTGIVHSHQLLIGQRAVHGDLVRSDGLLQTILLVVTEVVDVALQHEVGDGLLPEVVAHLVKAVGILVLMVRVVQLLGIGVGTQLHVDTAQLEGTAAHHGTGLLGPVIGLGDDIVTQGSQRQAGQVQHELIVVDLALEVDLQHLLLGGVDTHVVDGGITLLSGARVLDVKQKGCGLVVGVHLKETLPGEDDVVCGHSSTVGPVGGLQVELHGVLAGGLVLLNDVLLNEGLLDLAVLVQLEQSVEHQADHIGQGVVGIGLDGIQVVDVVGQVRGDVLALVLFLFLGLLLVLELTADKGEAGEQGSGTEKQRKDTLHHGWVFPPCCAVPPKVVWGHVYSFLTLLYHTISYESISKIAYFSVLDGCTKEGG